MATGSDDDEEEDDAQVPPSETSIERQPTPEPGMFSPPVDDEEAGECAEVVSGTVCAPLADASIDLGADAAAIQSICLRPNQQHHFFVVRSGSLRETDRKRVSTRLQPKPHAHTDCSSNAGTSSEAGTAAEDRRHRRRSGGGVPRRGACRCRMPALAAPHVQGPSPPQGELC